MTPEDTLTILRNARALIAEEKHWTRGAWARRAPGEDTELDADHPDATCWCLGGAVALASGDEGILESEYPYGRAQEAWKLLEVATASSSIISWNDKATHAMVITAFDRAIASLEEQQP